jgi:hypothetical protein
MLIIYLFILFSIIVVGTFKFQQIKSTSIFWIWLYLIAVFFIEILAISLPKSNKYFNNNFIFNIALPIYFLTTCLFFYKLYKKPILKNLFLILVSFGLLFYFYFLIGNSQSTINSKFFLISSWFFVISAILYFIQLIVYPNERDVLKSPEFYIASAVLFLYAFFIIYMSLIPMVLDSFKNLNFDLKFLKSIINIISYSFILIGFLCHQKKPISD